VLQIASTLSSPTKCNSMILLNLLRQVGVYRRLQEFPDGGVVRHVVHLHPAKQVLADELGQLKCSPVDKRGEVHLESAGQLDIIVNSAPK
jgi:hypothetical protein